MSIAETELAGVAVAALALVAILGLAEWLRRRHAASGETTRKLVHVLSGLLAAAFPWLLASAASVTLLAAGYALLILVTRRRGWLGAVHAVARRTGGGLYYPAAVALAFWQLAERPAAYVAALLVLAFADAAAALVGRRYGRIRYSILGDAKSLEGSLACLACALPCAQLPLVLLAGVAPAEAFAWSLAVGVVAAGLEAVAPRGSDNLAIPLGCGVLLSEAAAGAPPPPATLPLLVLVPALVALARRAAAPPLDRGGLA